jgi:hypothetical protein
MAVGGGDAFSLPATLMTIVLLWSFLQWTAPWWLPELLRRYPEREQRWRRFDRALAHVPFLLIFLAGVDLLKAAVTSDHTYAFLDQPEQFVWFTLVFCFAFSTAIFDHFLFRWSLFDEDESSLRAIALRWQGLLWPLLLFGFLTSDLFAVYSTPLPHIPSSVVDYGPPMIPAIAGVALASWAFLSAQSSRRQLSNEPDSPHLTIAGILVLIPILAAPGIMPMGGEWQNFSESVVLGNESMFALATSLFILILAWPNFLYLLTRVHEKRGQAKGRRFLGLTRIFGHTLIFTWASGVILLEPLPNVAGWHSAMWLSLTLTLPLAVAGLLGTGLPLVGLDERPRPDAWGFFLAITLALQFLTIREPLTATLVPGLAVSMLALPLLATHPERRPDLPLTRRGIESAVLIGLSVVALYFFREMMRGDEWGYLQGWMAILAISISGLLFLRLPDGVPEGVSTSGTPKGEEE